MASKKSKGTNTSCAGSSKSGSGAEEKPHGPWTKKCIEWLAINQPASSRDVFNNPKALSEIINVVKPNYHDLSNWRSVNRTFRKVTLEPWRRTATLVILPEDTKSLDSSKSKSLINYIDEPEKKRGITTSELLKILLDPKDPYHFKTNSFTRIKLRGMHMEDEMEFSSIKSNAYGTINVLPQILDIIGKYVLYMHWDHCKFEDTMRLGSFHTLILDKVKFTEKLVISDCIFKENIGKYDTRQIIRYDCNMNVTKLKVSGEFPIPLACIMTFIPNLKKLKVRNGNPDLLHNEHTFSNVVIPFASMRKYHRDWCVLTKLDVMHTKAFRIGFSPTNIFQVAKLPIAHLSVEVAPFLDTDKKSPNNNGLDGYPHMSTCADLITSMLREHKDTLKIFKIFRPPFSGTFADFPFDIQCEKMKELHIWGNVVENLNFLRKMPNLKVFFLTTVCFEKWEEMKGLLDLQFPYDYQPFQDDIIRFTGGFSKKFPIKMKFMTELTLELVLDCESIKTLSEWMRHLKIFRTIFHPKTFRQTCARFPKLDELGIMYGSKIDNDTITGVCDGEWVHQDNIRSFKDLKRFKMDNYCGESDLKDSAVSLGFIRLERLQSIEICVSEEMTKIAEDRLKLSIRGPVIFHRNYGPGPHGNYDCCQRSQFLFDVVSRIARAPAAEFVARNGRPLCRNCSVLTQSNANNIPGPSHGSSTFPGPSNGNGNFSGQSQENGNNPEPSQGNSNLPGTLRSLASILGPSNGSQNRSRSTTRKSGGARSFFRR